MCTQSKVFEFTVTKDHTVKRSGTNGGVGLWPANMELAKPGKGQRLWSRKGGKTLSDGGIQFFCSSGFAKIIGNKVFRNGTKRPLYVTVNPKRGCTGVRLTVKRSPDTFNRVMVYKGDELLTSIVVAPLAPIIGPLPNAFTMTIAVRLGNPRK